MPFRATCVQTFIPKIVSVPAQAVPLALLSFFGFVAPVKGVTQDQPARVKMFIQVRATASPAWWFPPLATSANNTLCFRSSSSSSSPAPSR